jgi:ankyrin repeat protein
MLALELNLSDLQDGATPLHYAVQVGALQTVKLLIKNRVDVNVADNVMCYGAFFFLISSTLFSAIDFSFILSRFMQDGWTPLHLAIQSRNRDIAKILLVNGADKTRRTKVCYAPMVYWVFFSGIALSQKIRPITAASCALRALILFGKLAYIFMSFLAASQKLTSMALSSQMLVFPWTSALYYSL